MEYALKELDLLKRLGVPETYGPIGVCSCDCQVVGTPRADFDGMSISGAGAGNIDV